MPILELKVDPSAMRRILRAISDALFRRGRTPANKPHPGVEGSGDLAAKTEARRTQATRQRLAEAVARLERLDGERDGRAGRFAFREDYGEPNHLVRTD